jgi:MraZ protein
VKKSEKMAEAGSWFLGEHEYTVDSQRRVAIPSQWRDPDPRENHFFLLPGRDKSIQVVPAATFQELLIKLRKVSFADGRAAVALATIGSMAHECACDKQGRISLTPKLLEHAGISDRAVLLGAVTTIQIWNPATWAGHEIESEAGLDVIQAIQERGDDLTDILSRAVQKE